MASARTSSTLNPEPQTSWSSRPRVVRILGITTAIGLVLGLLGVFLPKVVGDDESYARSDRAKVLSRASDYASTYNTYNVADLAGYQKRMKGLLTPKYGEFFVESTNSIFAAIKDKKLVSEDPKVRSVAIESIDEDSAIALVAVDATITSTARKAGVLRHFRWKLHFTKTGKEWLVSDFESVAAVSASVGDPSTSAPTPSATATEGED